MEIRLRFAYVSLVSTSSYDQSSHGESYYVQSEQPGPKVPQLARVRRNICALKTEGELYQRTQLDPILVIGRENLSLLRRPSWLKIELIIYKTQIKQQREDNYLEKEQRWDVRKRLKSAQFEKVRKESREKDQNEVKQYRQSLGYSDICLSCNHHLSTFRDGEKYRTH